MTEHPSEPLPKDLTTAEAGMVAALLALFLAVAVIEWIEHLAGER